MFFHKLHRGVDRCRETSCALRTPRPPGHGKPQIGFGLDWGSGKIPSGKHTKNYGKSPFLMGKSTISMVIFNSYVKLPEGTGNHGFHSFAKFFIALHSFSYSLFISVHHLEGFSRFSPFVDFILWCHPSCCISPRQKARGSLAIAKKILSCGQTARAAAKWSAIHFGWVKIATFPI